MGPCEVAVLKGGNSKVVWKVFVGLVTGISEDIPVQFLTVLVLYPCWGHASDDYGNRFQHV